MPQKYECRGPLYGCVVGVLDDLHPASMAAVLMSTSVIACVERFMVAWRVLSQFVERYYDT